MQTSLNALRLALVPSILARNLRNAFRCCHSQSDIYAAAQLSATPISLRDLATFGKQAAREPDDVLLLAAKFLKRELPIRLAHRIVELENLPHGMAAVPSIKTVADWYRQSYAVRWHGHSSDIAYLTIESCRKLQILSRCSPPKMRPNSAKFCQRCTTGMAQPLSR